MTITTAAEHTVLASGGDQVKRHLSVGGRAELFTDQITALVRDADNDTIVALDHAVSWAGALNPAVPHLTVDIGTTSGARDVGSVRLRYTNSTNTRATIAETGDADCPIEVGHYLSIREEFLPWQIPKRVVLTRDGGGNITAVTEYFDYDVGYSGGANALNPKPNITAGVNADGSPKEIQRAGRVDGYGTSGEQTYRTLYLSAEHSIAMNSGKTIASYLWTWTGSGALVGGYSLTDPAIELQLEAGFHHIGLIVQDSVGSTSEYLWFGVWAHNDAYPPLDQFAVTSDETGYDQGTPGREMQFEFFGDTNDVDETVLPKGSLLCYWEEAVFDDGAPPESYRKQCVGWVFNDDPLLKREDSRYGVKIGAAATWKQLFDANSITLVDTGSTPTTYTEMANMTVDRVLDWSLRAVDTLRHLCNVYYTGVTAVVERMTLPLGTAWGHLTETAPKALLAQPACDSYGNIWLRTPIWGIPESARSVRPVALAVTAADWWDENGFDLPTELPPTVGVVNAAGELWQSGERVLYASIAPMASGGAGTGREKMPDQFLQLPDPQTTLNVLSGLYYAHANNKRKRLSLVLAGNEDVIEPSWAEPLSVTWAYDTVHGVTLSAALFIVSHISIAHTNEPDSRTPPKVITLTLEQVTAGAPGKTVPVLQMVGVTPPEVVPCAVTAGFTFVTTGYSTTFTNTTSGDTPIAYFWDFGDGVGYSTLANPVYTYTAPGLYTVTLSVQSECFAYDTFDDEVEIVVAAFHYTVGASRVVHFFDNSGAGSGIASWAWDFGDTNTSSSQNPTHTYAGDGPYTVTLEITSNLANTDDTSQSVITSALSFWEWDIDLTQSDSAGVLNIWYDVADFDANEPPDYSAGLVLQVISDLYVSGSGLVRSGNIGYFSIAFPYAIEHPFLGVHWWYTNTGSSKRVYGRARSYQNAYPAPPVYGELSTHTGYLGVHTSETEWGTFDFDDWVTFGYTVDIQWYGFDAPFTPDGGASGLATRIDLVSLGNYGHCPLE